MSLRTEKELNEITPQQALTLLQKGNQRFIESRQLGHPLMQQVERTTSGQFPYAVVLGCIDSRVPPELIFDVGIGDIFAIRIAGNIVNEDILGSMEFACELVGSKHIVVLGHTDCGAVKGAAQGVQLGHLTGLVDKLQTAVSATVPPNSGATPEQIDQIAEKNVRLVVEQIQAQSPILRTLLNHGMIGISGAMYDVASGRVAFL